jgi:hypothetical protein
MDKMIIVRRFAQTREYSSKRGLPQGESFSFRSDGIFFPWPAAGAPPQKNDASETASG